MKGEMMHTDDWHGCYRRGWGQNRLRPASFAHPAKVSYGLSVRIYEHALAEGWIEPEQIVLDPFVGIGGFALEAMRYGLNFIGVELEQRFVDMAQGCDCTGISKADWIRFQGRWGKARYRDGRHWCPECIMKAGMVADEREFKVAAKRKIKPLPLPGTKWGALAKAHQPVFFDLPAQAGAAPTASYVRNSGQIPCTGAHHYRGNIETWEAQGMAGTAVIVQGDSRRLGEVLARANLCLSSPPYADSIHGSGADAARKRIAEGRYKGLRSDVWTSPGNIAGSTYGDGYGQTAGNLGNLPDTGFEAALAISSPVYHSNTASDDPDKRGGLYRDPKRRNDKTLTATYSEDEAQLAQMPEGSTPGQLGQQQGSTFWAASRQILEQVYQVLAPGGHAIWVLKMFVRSGRLVDFPGQWETLCQSVGFKTVCKHRAWMNKNAGIVQTTLDGDEVSMEKWYKSFFRLLCERKGAPRIDWELVLCMEKPQ